MKSQQNQRFFGAIRIFWAIWLLFLILVLPPAPVEAAAAITLTPTHGPVGTSVTVTGTGFTAGRSFTVTYAGQPIASGTVDWLGRITATFSIPVSVKGSQTIVVTDNAPTPKTAQVTFWVTPSIAISPTSGPVGTAVTVSGRGFTAAEPNIRVTYGGVEQKTGITADSRGSWTVTFTVPASPKGAHRVVGFSAITLETEVPHQTFTVTPKISLSPTSGGVQTLVTVAGTGFAANEANIRVTFGGTTVKTGITADDKGSWTTTFLVPVAIRGDHIVDAMGTTLAMEVPDVVFTIAPRLRVEPTSAPVWATITITGTGFASNETKIRLLYDGIVVKENINADANGLWTVTLEVPPGVRGSHTIDASGSITLGTEVPDLTFIVTSAIKIAPISVAVGEEVTVTGSGFDRNSPITIAYAKLEVGKGITTDATGSFRTTFKVPRSKGGEHQVEVKDAAGNSAITFITLETTPPPTPSLSSPPPGARVSFLGWATPQFSWSAVTDQSGVVYILEIARDEGFTSLQLRKVELSENVYELRREEALSYGIYYWRVKAVDLAQNESPWTPVQSFQVGLMETWLFIVLVIFGVVLIAGIILRLRWVLKEMRWEKQVY